MKTELQRTERRRTILFYGFFFLSFAFVLMFVPHSADDTYYDYLNMTDFSAVLHFSAWYGNGRILGNMLSIYLCKSVLFGAIARSFLITATAFFLSALTRSRGNTSTDGVQPLLIGLLMLGISRTCFGELYAWISAFANYLPPVLCALICVYLIQNGVRRYVSVPLVILLGFAGQLFNEGGALNNAVLACGCVVLYYMKNKKVSVPALCYAAAAAAGAGLMLYARKFWVDPDGLFAASGFDEIETLRVSARLIYINAGNQVLWLAECSVLTLLLSVICIALIRKRDWSGKKKTCASALLIAYPVFNLFYATAEPSAYASTAMKLLPFLLMLLLTALYFAAVVCTVFLLPKQERLPALCGFGFAGLIAAYTLLLPLVGARFHAYTYFVLCFSALWMLRSVKLKAPKQTNPIRCACAAVLACVFVFLFAVYYNCYTMDHRQDVYIREQIAQGADTVYICPLGSKKYFHHSMPMSRLGYRYFRSEPNDIEFIEITNDEWEELQKK